MMGRKSAAQQQNEIEPRPATVVDPLEINVRLYKQMSDLLARLELEDVDIKTHYMALIAVARMQAVFVALRKEKIDAPSRGSAVRKYAAEFTKAHDSGGRKKIARGPTITPEPEPEPSIESLLDGDDDLA